MKKFTLNELILIMKDMFPQNFMVDPSLPPGDISRLVVLISKSKDIGPVADDFVVVPFPEDLCKENMVLKYCWKLLLHTWWKVRACSEDSRD